MVGFMVYEADADGTRSAETYVDSSTTSAELYGQAGATYVVTAVTTAPDEDGGYWEESKFSAAATLSGGAPGTPNGLSAAPTSGGIRLLWDNTSANETGFTIQRSTSADFSTDLQTFTVAADVTSYLDATGTSGTSVQPDVTYYYQVEATNSSGSSAFSNTASALVTLPTVSVTALPITATFAGPDGHPQEGYFDFHRTGDPSAALTADVSYDGGTAESGRDYSGTLPMEVTFEAGEQDVLVPVVPANATPNIGSLIEAGIVVGVGYLFSPVQAPIDIDPHGVSVKLGDGSDNIILQGSADGDTNRVPIDITIPPDQPTGSTVTLHATNSGILKLWTGNTTSATAISWGDDGSVTWTIGSTTNPPPSELWVGATAGSTTIGDIKFSLSDSEAADGGTFAPAATATSQSATAVRVSVDALTNPNGDAMAPNGDVTGLSRNWLIGQAADLAVDIQEPSVWKLTRPASVEWSIPGDAVYAYNLGLNRAETMALGADNGNQGRASNKGKVGTSQAEVQWVWESTSTTAPSFDFAAVSATVQIAGLTVVTGTTFDVYSPVASWSEKLGSVGITARNQFGLIGSVKIGVLHGNNMTGSVNTNALPAELHGGTFYATQLISPQLYVELTDGTSDHRTNNGDQGLLDTQIEMPTERLQNGQPGPTNFDADGTAHVFVDSPHVPLLALFKSALRIDTFADFLMFTPPGSGSTPVALQESSFNWEGLAAKSASNHWTVLYSRLTQADSNGHKVTSPPGWSAVVIHPARYLRADGTIDNRLP